MISNNLSYYKIKYNNYELIGGNTDISSDEHPLNKWIHDVARNYYKSIVRF